jgi:myotubularin-related protein 6/7/8
MLVAGLPGDSTKFSSNAADVLSVDQLAAELGSVALDWKTLRNIRECVCSTPFDHFSRKVRFFYFFITGT